MKYAFYILLTVIFVALKLDKDIEWDWIWVVSPLWLPFAFAAGYFLYNLLTYTPKSR